MPLKKSISTTTDLSIYVVDVTPDGQLVTGGSVYQDSDVQNRIVSHPYAPLSHVLHWGL
jgi:hypothetical protein